MGKAVWEHAEVQGILERMSLVLQDVHPDTKVVVVIQSNRLFTMDTRAIHHILTHSNDYQKPSQVRYNLSQILGKGGLCPQTIFVCTH